MTSAVRARSLVKSQSPSGQHRTTLALTQIGGQALRDMTARRRAIVADVVTDWMPSDIARLNQLLIRMADDFGAEES